VKVLHREARNGEEQIRFELGDGILQRVLVTGSWRELCSSSDG
jgi:hypothetical protein